MVSVLDAVKRSTWLAPFLFAVKFLRQRSASLAPVKRAPATRRIIAKVSAVTGRMLAFSVVNFLHSFCHCYIFPMIA
jgi:hypothetical protein